MTALHDVQRAVTRVCFSETPSEADLELLGTRERWLLYRRMVRDRLDKMLASGLKRTKDAISNEEWVRLVRAWFDAEPPASRYIREIVPPFVRFADSRWSADVPAFTRDLAKLESALWEAGYDEASMPPAVDFDFDKLPQMNPTVRLFEVEHAVHLKADEQGGYAATPQRLCVFRRPDNFRPATWSLNPMAYALMQRWVLADATVTESVKEVTAARGVSLTQKFVEDLAGLLATFLEQGMILGSKP